MEAYFQGKKELFDGLAVASLEKNWIEYPVLHLDFSGRACRQKLAMMYIILELMGEYVEVERATSNGRTSALPQPGLPLHPPLQ